MRLAKNTELSQNGFHVEVERSVGHHEDAVVCLVGGAQSRVAVERKLGLGPVLQLLRDPCCSLWSVFGEADVGFVHGEPCHSSEVFHRAYQNLIRRQHPDPRANACCRPLARVPA